MDTKIKIKNPRKCQNHKHSIPRHQTKKGWWTNNDKKKKKKKKKKRHTDARSKIIATEVPPWSSEKKTYWSGVARCGLKPFYSQETSPLIQTVRIAVLYLICETSQWNKYNHKRYVETKQRVHWRFEARTQENHKQDHDVSDHKHW